MKETDPSPDPSPEGRGEKTRLPPLPPRGRGLGGWVCPFIIFFLAGCASQGPPSGGPPDRTPPVVLATSPPADAAQVPRDQPIRIRFSEGMDRRSAETSCFISPPPQGGLRFRWRGDELEITPDGGLKTGRTYLVSVGSGSRDDAGNPMGTSHDFAFTTGDRIDRGEIRGRIVTPAGGSGQVFALAYVLPGGDDPDPGSAPPDYLTQAGTDGTYRFPRLAPGRYRVFAYQDRDGDRVWSPEADPLALPPADATLENSETIARIADCRPVLRDTTRVTLHAVRATDGTHLIFRFDRPVRPPLTVEIANPAGPLRVKSAHLDAADSSRALLLTAAQTPGATYRVTRLTAGDGPVTISAAAAFKGTREPDRTPPRIAATIPPSGADNVPLDAQVEVIFSEPLQTGGVRLAWVATDSTGVPAGDFLWPSPDRLRFTPASPWPPGAPIRLLAFGRPLADEAGNRLSGDLLLTFTTLDSSRLGSLAGALSIAPDLPPGQVRLRAVSLEIPPRTFTRTLGGPGEFALSGLPPGKYDLTAFLDADGDGRWTEGRVSPFIPAEPVAGLPEPVTVRPRWVTGGLELRIEAVQYGKNSERQPTDNLPPPPDPMAKRQRYFPSTRSRPTDILLICLMGVVFLAVAVSRFTTRTELEERQQKARLLLEQVYRLQRAHFEQYGTYIPIEPGRNTDVLKLDGAFPYTCRVEVPDSASFIATAWASVSGTEKRDVWTVDQDHPVPIHQEKD